MQSLVERMQDPHLLKQIEINNIKLRNRLNEARKFFFTDKHCVAECKAVYSHCKMKAFNAKQECIIVDL